MLAINHIKLPLDVYDATGKKIGTTDREMSPSDIATLINTL